MKTAKREIKRVRGFRIGQEVEHGGVRCEIESFPTRQTVVLKRLSDSKTGNWATSKVPVMEISRI
jgi:hypothetical protein